MTPLRLTFKETVGPGWALRPWLPVINLGEEGGMRHHRNLHSNSDFTTSQVSGPLEIMRQKEEYPFLAFSDLGMA